LDNSTTWNVVAPAQAGSFGARMNTTISAIHYDSGSTGWCNIQPAAIDAAVQPGMLILIAGSETVKVYQVFNPITTTTVASIVYASGTTGLCSVVPTTPSIGLVQDNLVNLGGEVVRILSVSVGPDGLIAFRASTTSNHAAGAALTGLSNFRVYATGTFVATDT